MIRKLRYLTISGTGLFTLCSLGKTGYNGILLFITLLTLIWLFAEPRFPWLHLIFLPLFVMGVITGFLLGSPPIQQLALFTLIIFSWDIDSLYLNTKDILDKKDELKLLYPLLRREIFSFMVILTVWFVSARITISISFWPLLLLIVLLIFTMRKIFQS